MVEGINPRNITWASLPPLALGKQPKVNSYSISKANEPQRSKLGGISLLFSYLATSNIQKTTQKI